MAVHLFHALSRDDAFEALAVHTAPPAKIPSLNLDKLPNPDAAAANAAAAAPLFCQPAETARRISCSLHSSAAAVLCKCAAAAGG